MRGKRLEVGDNPELVKAISEYIRRRDGVSFPASVFERGKWRVLPEELLPCCSGISESMLFRHCFSVKHIASRYGISEPVLTHVLREQNQESRIRRSLSGGIAFDPAVNPWGLFNELVNWLCARYRCYDLEPEQRALLGDITAAGYWCKVNQHVFDHGSRPLWILALIQRAREEVQKIVGSRYQIVISEGWWLVVENEQSETGAVE